MADVLSSDPPRRHGAPGERPVIPVPLTSAIGPVLRLALPVLGEQALDMLVSVSDMFLTGRYLSEQHMAAIAVSSYVLWFLGSLFVLVSAGSTALVARFVGGRRPRQAVRVVHQSIWLGLVVGLAAAAVCHALAPEAIQALRLRGPTADYAVEYLQIVILALPLMAVRAVGIACLQGAGDTVSGMAVMIAVNLVSLAVSWLLVLGAGPVPRLGWAGIGIGAAAGEALGGVLVFLLLRGGRAGLCLNMRLAPDRWMIWRILRISIPATGESLTAVTCQLWFLAIINGLGEAATAAHGVAIRCESLAFLSGGAFAVAATALVGQSLGARAPDRAAHDAWTAFGLGAGLMGLMGTVFFVFAPDMFRLFVGNTKPDVVRLGVPVLRLVAWAMPFLAAAIIFAGALRGAGDTRWPWVFALVGYLGIRIPLAYVCAYGLGWGLWGAWTAMYADLVVRGCLNTGRFIHGGWKTVRV